MIQHHPDDAPVKTRLYVEESLSEGATVGLDHERAHYLRHVLRLDRGDRVALFNGRDGEWSARIDGFGKGWCSLAVASQRRTQTAEPDLWLLFAPIKRARIDFVAEKAAELGASAVWPVITRHTDVARVNTDRLRANAIEAAEQCERLTVPEIREPIRLDQAMAGWDAHRPLLLCAEAGPVRPIRHAAAARARPAGDSGELLGLGYLWLTLAFLEGSEEERLVDPALEDRHAHLHALRNDLSAVHARLSGQLGRRQVVCQSLLPSGCGLFVGLSSRI